MTETARSGGGGITRARFVSGGVGAVGSLALFGLPGCFGSDDATSDGGRPRRGGVLEFAIGSVSPSDSLDPTHTFTANEDTYIGAMYEFLCEMNNGWKPEPRLAERWEASGDLKTWTFWMRKGVRFHDGEPFGARDAAYTLSRVLDPKVGAIYFTHWARILDREGIKAPDDRRLVLSLKEPSALPPILFGIRCHEVIRDGTTDFKKANGTGPFKLKSFVPGQQWELERNPNYWKKGRPYLDGIRGVAATDGSGRVQSVLSGSADVSDTVDYSLARTARGSSIAGIHRDRARIESYIALDVRRPPFDDNRVRSAFKLAMGRELILKTAYQGYGEATRDTPVPIKDPFYPADLGPGERNIAEAKRLLAEAGYADGLDVTLDTGAVIGGMVDMNVAFSETVSEAGLRVKLKQHPAETYYEQVWTQVPMFVQWIVRRHPSVRLPMTFTSDAVWAETHYPRTPLDAMVDRINLAPNDDPRYAEPLTWIAENEGYLNPGFGDGVTVRKNRVRGLKIRTAGDYVYDDVYLDS